ncbi:MAG: peptidase Ste24p [Candidatus Angelobacter sp.]|nr:peptidase Ste24p [Candidatus Angelobacter sp.]
MRWVWLYGFSPSPYKDTNLLSSLFKNTDFSPKFCKQTRFPALIEQTKWAIALGVLSALGWGQGGVAVAPVEAPIPVREYLPVLSAGIMRVFNPEIRIAQPNEVRPRFQANEISRAANAKPENEHVIDGGSLSKNIDGRSQAVADVSAQVAVGGNANATVSRNGMTSIATDAAGHPIFIKKKYDVGKIGDRGIGGGVNFYSLDKEVLLGKELAAEVEQSSKMLTDPVVSEYINRIGQNLVRNSDAQVPFTIKIIDSDEVNAFALPGGFFYVNTGLILAAENEAELAGVMAHEIAHVAARHATKNQTKRDIWNIASIPLIFVGGPAAMAVRNIASLAVPMSFMKFSRDAEREADLLGIEYEYATGYDPSAMVNFFERLSSNEKHRKNFIARAFATHPMNEDRVRRAQKEMDTMLPPNEEYLLTTSEFDEVKARLVKLTSYKKIGDFDPKHPTLRKSTSSDSDKDKDKSDKDEDRPTLKKQ